MRLKLEKYHGLGNDYLVFDPEHNGMELTPERVKLLCNRNLGDTMSQNLFVLDLLREGASVQLYPNFWGVRGAPLRGFRVRLAENRPQKQCRKNSSILKEK